MNYALGADRLKALIVKNVKEIDNQKKKMQEAHESRIAALNSTTLGQKLPEDVIRKISEYGGRKRKTRKGKKSTKRKTFRRRK
jgi:GTP cyclohydrolase II